MSEYMESPQRMIGTMKSFRNQWGFLISDEVDGDVMVHLRDSPDLRGLLQGGDVVEFELHEGLDGKKKALNVRRAAGEAHSSMHDLNGPAPTQMVGVLKSFRDKYGFLTADGIDGDILLHVRDSPQLTGLLRPGDAVTFELHEGADGKKKACHARKRLMGSRDRAPTGSDVMTGGAAPTRMVGTMRSFKDTYGFLTADGVDGDIMVHVRDSPDLSGVLRSGDVVDFELYEGVDGKKKACNVQRALQGSQGMEVTSSADGAVYTGVIASFREGWGLVESPSLDGKIFCGSRENPLLTDPVKGDEIEFQLGINSKDGRSKVVNARLLIRDQSQCVGMRVRGEVVSMKAAGWGFASSTRFKGDILVGKTHLAQSGLSGVRLDQGDVIEFEVVEGPKGYEAADIVRVSSNAMSFKPAPFVPLPPPPPPTVTSFNGGRMDDRSRSPRGRFRPALGGLQSQTFRRARLVSGVCKSFHDGWGFLTSRECEGDIYVNLKDSPALQGAPLEPGEPVEFEINYRPGGAGRNNGAQAINVQRQSGYSTSTMGRAFDSRHRLPSPGGGAMRQGGNGRARGSSLVGSRVQGSIKNLKGDFGFAQVASCEGDVLLGKNNLNLAGINAANLKVGDWLEFEIGMGKKGYEALDIRIL